MADLLYSNLLKNTCNFSALSIPFIFSSSTFSTIRFAPFRRRFSHSSFRVKLSSDSSQFIIISTTEHSDGTVSFKFGDSSEILQNSENVNGENEVKLEKKDSSSLGNQTVAVDAESDGTMTEKIVVSSVKLKEITSESSDSLIEDEEDCNSSRAEKEVENLSVSSDFLVEDEHDYSRLAEKEVENLSVSSDSSVEDEQDCNSSLAEKEVENSSVSSDFSVEDEHDCNSSLAEKEVENSSVSSDVLVEDEQDCHLSSLKELENSSDLKAVKNEDKVVVLNNVVVKCDASVSIGEVAEESNVASEELDDDNNDGEIENGGSELLSSNVSQDMSNGGKLEYGDDGIRSEINDSLSVNLEASDVALSLKDEIVEPEVAVDDDKIKYGGDVLSSIVSEEMYDGGRLDYSGDESLPKISEPSLKLDALDTEVSLKDEIIEPEPKPKPEVDGGNDTVELISTKLEAEPIFNEEMSFDSRDDVGVVMSSLSLNNDKVTVEDKCSIAGLEGDPHTPIFVDTTPGVETLAIASETSGDSLNEMEMSAAIFTSSAVASVPHSVEALAGGNDAYFVSDDWFCVADGVGQWSLEGVDAGLYAHELMQQCEMLVKNMDSGITNVKELLKKSHAMTQSTGSARVIIAHVSNQVLHVANIGDSGFVIVRNGTVFKKSSPMVHEFGFPYAIGLGDDSVEDIEEYHVELEDGDVIITATDGLFDNLYDEEIASVVSKALEDGLHVQDIAELLVSKAQEVGRSDSARSPFADAAKAAGHPEYRGGKHDHVTLIVSLVQTR